MIGSVRLPTILHRRLASQLGNPRGAAGRLVARILNKGNAGLISSAIAAAGPRPGDSAADIGFGGGIGLPLLLDVVGADGRVYGVDRSEPMVRRAERANRRAVTAGRLDLRTGSMTALPLADASLDAVISTNTVYFIDDVAIAFAEFARVLRPGGRLVLGVADPEVMADIPFTKYGFRIRPMAELTDALATAGLSVTDHRRLDESARSRHLLVAVRPATNP
jgi:SAM-dependent methyltransferase